MEFRDQKMRKVILDFHADLLKVGLVNEREQLLSK